MHAPGMTLLKTRMLNKNNLNYFDVSMGFNKKLNLSFNYSDSIDTSYNPGNPVVNTELLLNGQLKIDLIISMISY